MKSKKVEKKEPAIQAKEISPDQYVNSLPEDRKRSRKPNSKNYLKEYSQRIPRGNQLRDVRLCCSHKLYPAGYHLIPSFPFHLLVLLQKTS